MSFIELDFRKDKSLICRTYHPPSQNDECYFSYLDKALETYSNYEKVFITWITDHYTESFKYEYELSNYIESILYEYELSNLVKEKTCFKNLQNSSCIDL